ncbi:MAG: LacI family DNA-binding transcriptional regulator [Acidimicrobiales bacterium]
MIRGALRCALQESYKVLIGYVDIQASTDTATEMLGATDGLVGHLARIHRYAEIGVVGGPTSSPDAVERLQSIRDAARDEGVTVVEMGCGDYSAASGTAIIRTYLESGMWLPRAVIWVSDQTALGVLAGLEERSIAVPQQCAVTGFDDIAVSRFVRPALTTVRQPADELGSLAIATILDAIHAGQRQGRDIMLSAELVVRQSCGC